MKCLGVSCKMRTRGVVCVMDSDNAAFQICSNVKYSTQEHINVGMFVVFTCLEQF